MIVKYDFATNGERLFYHVQESLLNDVDWARVATGLLASGRGDELVMLFREIATVNTTCRLVQAARSIRSDPSGNTRQTDDPMYIRDLKRYLRETMLIPASEIDKTFRLTEAAACSAATEINATTRRRLMRKAQQFNEKCYMCGCELDFEREHPIKKIELEHIWPNSYGGDSSEDNLLPVCQGCNRHKGDLATWGMAGVQSLILGISPSQEALKIRGDFSFALHYFAARQILARNPQKNLKWAMQRLGPRQRTARAIDVSQVADFFNLEIHDPTITL